MVEIVTNDTKIHLTLGEIKALHLPTFAVFSGKNVLPKDVVIFNF
jgi:hypothetical protein